MPAITSTDVTVTVAFRDLTRRNKLNRVTMAFGNGALTYPAGGIPFGALSRLGLYVSLDLVNIEQPSADGYVYKIDKTNRKIRIYQSAGFTPAGTVAAPVFTGTPISPGTPAGTVDAGTHVFSGAAMANITPAGSNAAPAFAGAAVAVAALAEMATGFAPAATTLNMLVYGR